MQWPKSFPAGLLEVEYYILEDAEFKKGIMGEYKMVDGQPGIKVRAELSGAYRDYVQAHETVHAWLDMSGLSNLLSSKMTEAACDALAPYVVQLGTALQEEVGNGDQR